MDASTNREVVRVVVSSQEIATWSASTSRRLMPRSRAAAHDLGGPVRHARPHGVEELLVHDLDAAARSPVGEHGSHPVRPGRDRPQASGPVIDRVHRRDHGEQHLRGADVAGRLLPADVLLPGLQREPVGRLTVGVRTNPDQPAGQLPLKARRTAR